MIKKIVIFFIRKKLGVKRNERFRFVNQRKRGVYHFSDTCLIKTLENKKERLDLVSSVPLNWLLSDECEIIKLK